jgi:hypothetical protein
MRLLALLLSLGLLTATATASAACTGMQTAGKDQVVASSGGKAPSTPIPAKQDGKS